MMKVEKLKKNNPKTYTVTFLDTLGQIQSYVVSEDLVVNHRLIKGKELDETTFRHFLADYSIDAMLLRTQSLLSRLPKTVYEAKVYLRNLDVSEQHIKLIIDKLKTLRYLDDDNYVRLYLERAFHNNANGPLKIEYDLKLKGIPESKRLDVIQALSDKDIRHNMERLFDKKMLSLKSKPKTKAMLLMKQYLYQKGYELSVCETFILSKANEFNSIEAELKSLEKDYDKILKKLESKSLSSYELRQKIIQHLMAKGYRYDTIKQFIEGRIS